VYAIAPPRLSARFVRLPSESNVFVNVTWLAPGAMSFSVAVVTGFCPAPSYVKS
jgi:hypothetical protein